MNIMDEKWATIPGFPNYEISNLGKIEKVGKTKRIPITVNVENTYVSAFLTYAPRKSKQVNVKVLLDQCFADHIYSDHSIDDLEGEIWKDVVGWEDSHEVSNLGRIRTKERMRAGKHGTEALVRPRIKETYLDEDGYERVCLYEDNKSKLFGVHRVVAQAFVSNPDNLPQVNHKDSNKANNRADNLEWMTGTDNIRHSIERGTRDPHRCRRPVVRLEDNKHFDSIAELHREIGGYYNEIVYLLNRSNGESALIKGNHYSYVDEEYR